MLIFRKRIWLERLRTARHYYKNLSFTLIDLTFGLIALFSNPYRICRKFLEKKGAENIYAYGETPYSTYERIAEQCGMGSDDVWIELGAGRGKGCFWLAQFIGCKVVGIEWIPQFVRGARLIRWLFRIKKVRFERLDIEKADLGEASVIYLYGLWPNLSIPNGVKIISVSEPLEGCRVLKSFWVRFPWGRTTAYLQEKRPESPPFGGDA